MTADEIRAVEFPATIHMRSNKQRFEMLPATIHMRGNKQRFEMLREIAAQLAELNENFRMVREVDEYSDGKIAYLRVGTEDR